MFAFQPLSLAFRLIRQRSEGVVPLTISVTGVQPPWNCGVKTEVPPAPKEPYHEVDDLRRVMVIKRLLGNYCYDKIS